MQDMKDTLLPDPQTARRPASSDPFDKAAPASDAPSADAAEGTAPKAALARALRDARTAAGLTQSVLAQRSGLTQSHISRLESPTGSLPTLETILRYATACGASAQISFRREGTAIACASVPGCHRQT